MGLFENIFGKKIAQEITPSCDDDYNKLLNDSVAEVGIKNQKLADEYSFGTFERWDIDQQVGTLLFSDSGVPKLACPVTILGSYSAQTGTWLWGWANSSLLPHITEDTHALREYGEQNSIEDLAVAKTPATPDEAWALAALACRILGGLGLYRGPTGNGFVIMMLKGIERTS